MWWGWVLGGVIVAWLITAAYVSVRLGRGIRQADIEEGALDV